MSVTPDLAPPAYCSLDRAAYTQRMAEIMDLMLRFEGKVEDTTAGKIVRFVHGTGLKAALDALIEAERRCCSSVDFRLEEGDGGYALHVRVPEAVTAGDRSSNSCC